MASAPPKTVVHTINHFSLNADDVDQLCQFYSGVFGWTFQDMGMSEAYKIAEIPGGGAQPIGFGIGQRDEDNIRGAINYVTVESIDGYATKVEAHGGAVTFRFSVPGQGHGAVIRDPDGNPFGLWQADPGAV